MSIRCTITLSLDDSIAASLLSQRRHWIWSGLLKVFGFSTLAYFLLVLAVTSFFDPLTWQLAIFWLAGSLLFGLGMTVFMPFVSWMAMRFSAKRAFEQLSLGLPVEYAIDAKGLHATSELGVATLTWDRFYDFVQDRRVLLLRRTRRIFFVLPKVQLSSGELETILACLREAGVKEG